jgi:2-C-methyl-D-erythritol 4-phosphate cytidylyltransferase
MVDAIEVVCLDGWHEVLWAYAHQFNITKLKWVVSGGNTGQGSICNGVSTQIRSILLGDYIVMN